MNTHVASSLVSNHPVVAKSGLSFEEAGICLRPLRSIVNVDLTPKPGSRFDLG